MSKRGEKLLPKKMKLYIINYDRKIWCEKYFFAYNKECVTMDFKTQQNQFDVQKWFDSMWAGRDKCGEYDFCCKCSKTEKYPCARAAHRYNNNYIRIAVIRRHR